MSSVHPRTVDVPGATLTYDVRGDLDAGRPLLLFGSPMDASGFATLAAAFDDRPVVTYDPRGTGRSPREGSGPVTPPVHADDLRRLVEALGGGPVDAFATSGGAINALAWVAAAPRQVRLLVAHEPPASTLLEDRAAIEAAIDDIADTYARAGFGPATAKFIALVSHDGVLPAGFALPDLDPATFGLPTEDDGSRDDPLLHQNLRTSGPHPLDLPALSSVADRIVLARGENSGDTLAARGASAVAAAIGARLVAFPGNHTGFLGGEFGTHGEPAAFAARLREVLAA